MIINYKMNLDDICKSDNILELYKLLNYDVDKFKVFMLCCKYGNYKFVNHMIYEINYKCDELYTSLNQLYSIDDMRYTGLSIACMYGHIQVAKLLDELNPNTISKLDYQGLRLAASKGHLDIVRWIVEDYNLRECDLDKALILACQEGKFEVAKYLVSKGADHTQWIDNPGMRLYEYTKECGHKHISNWLKSLK